LLLRDEHPVGVFETARFDAIDPNSKSLPERSARIRGRANEIRNHGAARFDHPVAHPAHAARVLDAIHLAEAEVGREIGAHGVGIEHHGVEQRRQRIGKRRLSGARQTHDKDFPHHVGSTILIGLWLRRVA
jgi:hypothetical protein